MLKYERYDPTINHTSKNTKNLILSELNKRLKRKHEEDQENKKQRQYKKSKKESISFEKEKQDVSFCDISGENLNFLEKDSKSSEHSSQDTQSVKNLNLDTDRVLEVSHEPNDILHLFSNVIKIKSDLTFPLDHFTYLNNELKHKLQSKNYTQLFPVQETTIKLILNNSNYFKGDIFIGAPTGSGKTLAYVIPITQVLSKRKIIRLRCLVVLPTKELVSQVRECFEQCASVGGLKKIGISTGQRSFSHEQSKLVGNTENFFAGGLSSVDILICTPGRLVDHIQNTPNFSLQHLKYLVIDEADRLFGQRFQNWVEVVINEIETSKSYKNSNYKPVLDFPDAVDDPLKLIFYDNFTMDKKPYNVQKLIFSATLTCNPEKIANLRLRNPQLVLVEGSKLNSSKCLSEEKMLLKNDDMFIFFVPPTLIEYAILIESDAKPLYLYYLIKTHKMKGVLCFTKSNKSAARLFKLLTFIHEGFASKLTNLITNNDNVKDTFCTVKTFGLFTNNVPRKQRNIALEEFKNGDIKIFICSDLIARGIDLPQVFHVINYDIPQTSRQYIHRVGRTARAGKSGKAWTLYQEFESKKVRKILKSIGRKKEIIFEKISVTTFTNEYTINYKSALKKLKEYVEGKVD
ncbi:hypothetical protein PORY_002200 [Pneumocystis oryctolagi]|uniref:Uncharacterized protein n=1 Tax=Pneumocystis oryctolagi TaxID=42067 RepID=A0ACB7CAJ3_9ASCO|nr:hypothetical protein PORY_002200 [Pneumocystis oryctolagi]